MAFEKNWARGYLSSSSSGNVFVYNTAHEEKAAQNGGTKILSKISNIVLMYFSP